MQGKTNLLFNAADGLRNRETRTFGSTQSNEAMRKEKTRQRIINFSDGSYEAPVFLCMRVVLAMFQVAKGHVIIHTRYSTAEHVYEGASPRKLRTRHVHAAYKNV